MTRSENAIFIEITLNVGGRSRSRRRCTPESPHGWRKSGVRPDDVVISLIEVTKENWSFGGGRATYG